MSAQRGKASWFTAVLAVACGLLAAEVVMLARQNRGLKEALAAAPAAPAAARSRLAAGDALASFALRDADGAALRVEFGGAAADTLLLVFAEDCPACPMVFPTWEELVPHFRAEGYRVLAVRMDPETTGDAAQPVHGFAVHSLADASEVPLEKLATVPITALLDGAGRVRWIEYGTLSAERTAELVSLLDR